VTSIDTTLLSSIKLTGIGFDLITTNNIVLIGTYSCQILTATETLLICSVDKQQIPAGSYQFSLNVLSKGLAIIKNNEIIKFEFEVLSLSPDRSGTGGGIFLNINGSGFHSGFKVEIDDINCPIISVNYSLISCIIPANVNYFI